jgi:hypothetical protein
MTDAIRAGTILIEDGTIFPDSVRFESEPYSTTWKSVTNLDGYDLDRQIRAAGWSFFFLAGELKASAFGSGGDKTIHRAIVRLIAKQQPEGFNCLQIARVEWKRFLGLPYLSVAAHSRHIQKSMFLSRSKRLTE